MTDREKVIKGIGICVVLHSNCNGCPYNEDKEFECINRLREDALALIKAQEPRVMTLGEVMALEEGTGDVWIEDAPMPYTSHWIEAVTLVNKTDWQKTDEVTFSNEITYHPTSYRLNTAQGWRCWTGRPTEEQVNMKAWVEVIGGNEDDA